MFSIPLVVSQPTCIACLSAYAKLLRDLLDDPFSICRTGICDADWACDLFLHDINYPIDMIWM